MAGEDQAQTAALQANPETLLWEITTDRDPVVGAIYVEHCVLENCTLIGVGIAAWPEQLQWFRDGVTLGRFEEDFPPPG